MAGQFDERNLRAKFFEVFTAFDDPSNANSTEVPEVSVDISEIASFFNSYDKLNKYRTWTVYLDTYSVTRFSNGAGGGFSETARYPLSIVCPEVTNYDVSGTRGAMFQLSNDNGNPEGASSFTFDGNVPSSLSFRFGCLSIPPDRRLYSANGPGPMVSGLSPAVYPPAGNLWSAQFIKYIYLRMGVRVHVEPVDESLHPQDVHTGEQATAMELLASLNDGGRGGDLFSKMTAFESLLDQMKSHRGQLASAGGVRGSGTGGGGTIASGQEFVDAPSVQETPKITAQEDSFVEYTPEQQMTLPEAAADEDGRYNEFEVGRSDTRQRFEQPDWLADRRGGASINLAPVVASSITNEFGRSDTRQRFEQPDWLADRRGAASISLAPVFPQPTPRLPEPITTEQAIATHVIKQRKSVVDNSKISMKKTRPRKTLPTPRLKTMSSSPAVPPADVVPDPPVDTPAEEKPSSAKAYENPKDALSIDDPKSKRKVKTETRVVAKREEELSVLRTMMKMEKIEMDGVLVQLPTFDEGPSIAGAASGELTDVKVSRASKKSKKEIVRRADGEAAGAPYQKVPKFDQATIAARNEDARIIGKVVPDLLQSEKFATASTSDQVQILNHALKLVGTRVRDSPFLRAVIESRDFPSEDGIVELFLRDNIRDKEVDRIVGNLLQGLR